MISFLKQIDRKASLYAFGFLLRMTLIYGLWKLFQWTGGFYTHWYHSGSGLVGQLHELFRSAYDNLIYYTGKILLEISHFVINDILGIWCGKALEWRQYKGLPVEFRVLWLQGAKGIFIADSCLGIAPMIVLAGAIIAYPGKWYHKIWFIPLGMLAAQGGNIFRIIGLTLIQKYIPVKLLFTLSHSYVYLAICYSIVFLFIRWWIKSFGLS